MSDRKPTIVVTGASKGIGLAVTKILLQSFNANVAALSRTLTPELEALSGPSLLFVKTDVTDEAAVAHAMSTTEETYGSIDGLVLNAGTLWPLGHLGSGVPVSGWKEHFDVNFFGLVTCIQAALPALRKSSHGGRVVFVSSGAAARGVAGWGPYNCSKAAMNGLCRTLAFEEPDIASVALRPGMVDTDMQVILRDNPKDVMKQSDHNIFVSAHAEGRLVKPEDCGYVIAALAINCPKSLSGEFFEWNSDTAAPFRRHEHPLAQALLDRELIAFLLPPAIMPGSKIIRVDVHQHVFIDAQEKLDHNKVIGYQTPAESLPWTKEIAEHGIKLLNLDVVLVSYPPTCLGEISEAHRKKTRGINNYLKNLVDQDPQRFGMFAHLPFLDDVKGVLDEIAYAFDTLGSDGVSLTACYGEGANAKYLGNDLYDPIWEELDRRGSVVFIHGGMVPSSSPYPHEFLGVPITEVPNETFKTAAHLVVTGRKRKYPNVKIILTHGGGVTAYLAARVAALSNYMGCPLSPEEILEDFKTFYVDTALSGYEVNLQVMETFHGIDRILFGSDFFAVSGSVAQWYTRNVESYYANDEEKLKAVMGGNAARLFPRLAKALQ